MIRGLCERRGTYVTIQTAAKTADSVSTDVLVFSDARIVRAYVADQGDQFQWDNDMPTNARGITVYIPGVDAVTTEDRLKISDVIYQINSVTRPGFVASDAMAHTAITAQSAPQAAST